MNKWTTFEAKDHVAAALCRWEQHHGDHDMFVRWLDDNAQHFTPALWFDALQLSIMKMPTARAMTEILSLDGPYHVQSISWLHRKHGLLRHWFEERLKTNPPPKFTADDFGVALDQLTQFQNHGVVHDLFPKWFLFTLLHVERPVRHQWLMESRRHALRAVEAVIKHAPQRLVVLGKSAIDQFDRHPDAGEVLLNMLFEDNVFSHADMLQQHMPRAFSAALDKAIDQCFHKNPSFQNMDRLAKFISPPIRSKLIHSFGQSCLPQIASIHVKELLLEDEDVKRYHQQSVSLSPKKM